MARDGSVEMADFFDKNVKQFAKKKMLRDNFRISLHSEDVLSRPALGCYYAQSNGLRLRSDVYTRRWLIIKRLHQNGNGKCCSRDVLFVIPALRSALRCVRGFIFLSV